MLKLLERVLSDTSLISALIDVAASVIESASTDERELTDPIDLVLLFSVLLLLVTAEVESTADD